jgi:DNA-binding response OmpR family regulator
MAALASKSDLILYTDDPVLESELAKRLDDYDVVLITFRSWPHLLDEVLDGDYEIFILDQSLIRKEKFDLISVLRPYRPKALIILFMDDHHEISDGCDMVDLVLQKPIDDLKYAILLGVIGNKICGLGLDN